MVDLGNGSSFDLADFPFTYTVTNKNGTTTRVENVDLDGSSTLTYEVMNPPVFHVPGLNTVAINLRCDDDTTNNTIEHDIVITPSPSGADMFAGSTFEGYYNTGNMADPDITVPGYTITYEITPPTKFVGSNHGADWEMTANITTKGGVTVGASEGFVFTAPSGTGNGMITIDPDASLTDSMIYVSVKVGDKLNGCDSIVGRWLYIPFTPVPDFEGGDACLGDISQFDNLTTMGGKDPIAYKWRFGDPNTLEDTAESKLGLWKYSDLDSLLVPLKR